MSTPKPAPKSKAPDPKKKSRNLSAEDKEELDKLDNIFKRIKGAVPAAPYVLSTPSLHPYQHWSHQESRAWIVGHLFTSNEEHLQYRTFLYREPYQDCFTLQPGEEDIPEEQPRSQASNTTSQVPKKKISLSAYKSKQANGVITPGSKKQSPDLPAMKSIPTQANGFTKTEKESDDILKKEASQSQKRYAIPSVLICTCTNMKQTRTRAHNSREAAEATAR